MKQEIEATLIRYFLNQGYYVRDLHIDKEVPRTDDECSIETNLSFRIIKK